MFRLLRDLYRIWPGTLYPLLLASVLNSGGTNRIWPGTRYPLLHGMEERGWLKSNVLSASDETDACIRSRQRE
jgi:hypothetical protein